MTLQIIGAGLGRTGTVSLKLALEQLGFAPCYHMLELMANPPQMELWRQAADGTLNDWERLYADYRATVDYPGCACWRELAAFYPSARVIMSVRDPDDWFNSTQSTIFSPATRATLAQPQFAPVAALMDRIHPERNDRAAMTAAFEHHNRSVIDGVAEERLLVYRLEQGWAPLCAFLGVPIPDTPFPRTNSRAEIAALIAQSQQAPGTLDVGRLQQLMTRRLPPR